MPLDRSVLMEMFGEETSEHIAGLNRALLALEQNADDQASLREAFRIAHTIKGGARALGEETIGDVAHAIEDRLGPARSGETQLTSANFDALFRGVDALQQLLNAALHGARAACDVGPVIAHLQGQADAPDGVTRTASAASESAAAQPGSLGTPAEMISAPSESGTTHLQQEGALNATESPNTVRVMAERLDHLLDLTGELLTHRQDDAQQIAALARDLVRLGDLQTRLTTLAKDQATVSLAEAMKSRLATIGAGLEHLEQLEREVTHLAGMVQDEATSMRLVPVDDLLRSVARPIRDLARQQGKQVRVEVQAQDVVLDRKIVEALPDPLIHMARNAVDHGIEGPTEREKQGKPPEGTIILRAYDEGAHVVIEMTDDGRGIQRERVIKAAVERGLLSAEQGNVLSDTEVHELLFIPGFSTRERVTATSGRGIGLDVVRNNVRQLGGQALIDSQPGQYTCLRLLLPLTLVLTRALILRVGERFYGLPTASVAGALTVSATDVRTLQEREAICLAERTLPLAHLGHVLGMPEDVGERTLRTCVLLQRAKDVLAYQVDELIDQRDIVIKPLGKALASAAFFAGGAILEGGRVVLMLDPTALIEAALLARGIQPVARGVIAAESTAGPQAVAPHILVVDDAITTRELERSILDSAGYLVDVAVDGLDALGKLQRATFDLVVADVEMPRMNGFELTERIRSNKRTRDLPVIIITGRETEQDRRHGIEVGANAYIGKSTFEQDNLLETVRRFVR